VTDPVSRPAREVPDDTVLPFQVESLGVRGRVVRLGPLLDDVLARHAYPKPVAKLLAEAMVLACLLGAALKTSGRFILQTKGDGPVDTLVVDFEAPDKVRACARFDADAVAQRIAAGRTAIYDLLGAGHLAMTIDQGAHMQRYQGLVALGPFSLESSAHHYFFQSEQIPTVVRVSVAESVEAAGGGFRSPWRAAGFLVQFLPESPERRRMADLPPGDAPSDFVAPVHRDDDAWVTARTLAETLTPEELLDPGLSPEHLLYRLYHEQGVTVFDPAALTQFCRCSQSRITDMLRRFTPEERAVMREDGGGITVSCEFCSRRYVFTAEAVDGM